MQSTTRAHGPQRFGQPFDPPAAHEALHLAHEDDTFLVFAPRYCHELYRLALPVGCSVDEALQEVADARTSDASLSFDCLVPVALQPDRSFACLLATPVCRSRNLSCSRRVDGRLFAFHFKGRLNGASILLQVGLGPADPVGLRLAEEEVVEGVMYDIPTGGLITIRPQGEIFEAGHTLHVRICTWDCIVCPTPLWSP